MPSLVAAQVEMLAWQIIVSPFGVRTVRAWSDRLGLSWRMCRILRGSLIVSPMAAVRNASLSRAQVRDMQETARQACFSCLQRYGGLDDRLSSKLF